MNSLHTLLLDLGGVIANLDLRPAMERLSALGFPLPAGLMESSAPLTSLSQIGELAKEIMQLDRGELSGEAFAQMVCNSCTKPASVEEIIDIYNHLIVVPPCRLAWIAQMRRTHRVVLLSNLSDLHWAYFQQECERLGHPVHTLFDATFLSYQLKMAKPDAPLFQHVIDHAPLLPSDTLYIDDSEPNIRMGASLGFHTYLLPTNQLEKHVEGRLSGIIQG